MFLARDGRPGLNHLTLVLLNWKTMRVIGVRDDFGEEKLETFDVRQVDTGSADIRIAHWDPKKDACDCADAYVENWLRIRVSGQRWTANWLEPDASAMRAGSLTGEKK